MLFPVDFLVGVVETRFVVVVGAFTVTPLLTCANKSSMLTGGLNSLAGAGAGAGAWAFGNFTGLLIDVGIVRVWVCWGGGGGGIIELMKLERPANGFDGGGGGGA